MRRHTQDDFWRFVQKTSGCWLWTGTTDKGYGLFSINFRTIRAHRYSWFLAHGELPKGLLVCHKCDTPPCVNPDHLFLGTNADNTLDRHRKGRDAKGDGHGSRLYPERRPRGEDNPAAKLSEERVREIRSLYESGGTSTRKLSAQFQISQSVILDILHRRIWRHVA